MKGGICVEIAVVSYLEMDGTIIGIHLSDGRSVTVDEAEDITGEEIPNGLEMIDYRNFDSKTFSARFVRLLQSFRG